MKKHSTNKIFQLELTTLHKSQQQHFTTTNNINQQLQTSTSHNHTIPRWWGNTAS